MEWIAIGIIVGASLLLVLLRAWRAGRRLLGKPAPGSACCSGCGDQPCSGSGPRDCGPSSPTGVFLLVLLPVGCLAVAGPARAVDTIETWDPGATNVEFYLGAGGLGRPSLERNLDTEMVLGYGLVPGLSTFFSAVLAADGDLASGSAGLVTGLFGTPLDTDHVDLDLLLACELTGPGLDQFSLAPGFELVYTNQPEMLGWGLYLRSFTHLSGQAEHGILVEMSAAVGGFVSLAEGHQLLLELDGAYRPRRDPESPAAELGGLALGYNLVLHPSLELIHQLTFDLPQGPGEPFAAGIRFGFIASL